MNCEFDNKDIYFYACEYMAKTELYDRTMPHIVSEYDSTESIIIKPFYKSISNEYARRLRDSYGYLWDDIYKTIKYYNKYSAQKWIDEYYRLKKESEEEE